MVETANPSQKIWPKTILPANKSECVRMFACFHPMKSCGMSEDLHTRPQNAQPSCMWAGNASAAQDVMKIICWGLLVSLLCSGGPNAGKTPVIYPVSYWTPLPLTLVVGSVVRHGRHWRRFCLTPCLRKPAEENLPELVVSGMHSFELLHHVHICKNVGFSVSRNEKLFLKRKKFFTCFFLLQIF